MRKITALFAASTLLLSGCASVKAGMHDAYLATPMGQRAAAQAAKLKRQDRAKRRAAAERRKRFHREFEATLTKDKRLFSQAQTLWERAAPKLEPDSEADVIGGYPKLSFAESFRLTHEAVQKATAVVEQPIARYSSQDQYNQLSSVAQKAASLLQDIHSSMRRANYRYDKYKAAQGAIARNKPHYRHWAVWRDQDKLLGTHDCELVSPYFLVPPPAGQTDAGPHVDALGMLPQYRDMVFMRIKNRHPDAAIDTVQYSERIAYHASGRRGWHEFNLGGSLFSENDLWRDIMQGRSIRFRLDFSRIESKNQDIHQFAIPTRGLRKALRQFHACLRSRTYAPPQL